MPYYWSQIETLENLQYVAGLVDGFNQDRFLAAIMGKPLGKGKIVHMRNELNEITDKLEEEYLVLEEFGKTFNEKFATRNNQYFSSAMTLLRKMHSGTSKMAENNPAIKMRKESKDEKQFAERGFHNLTESATVVLASKEMIEEAKRGEFTAPEVWLFDAHERSHIRRVREIIRKFDTYLPEDYTRKTLPAKYIACLLRWCKPREDKAFVKYFKETYEETGGKLSVPKNPAVNQQKNELTKSDADYVKLVEKWEKIA